MKILALGNSFSEDCTAYLQPLTGLYVRNLYIGGCSLETHARNLDGSAAAYVLEADGTAADDRRHAAAEVIAGTDWDVVTVQQCSGLSGIYESYFPYLDTVLAHIRRLTRADIVFNETWAYAPDSTHEAFADYKRDTVYMFGRIVSAAGRAAKRAGLPLLRTGEAVQQARDDGRFGSLCRDGFHLDRYGRFAAAVTWADFFGAARRPFVPDGADPEKIAALSAMIGR